MCSGLRRSASTGSPKSKRWTASARIVSCTTAALFETRHLATVTFRWTLSASRGWCAWCRSGSVLVRHGVPWCWRHGRCCRPRGERFQRLVGGGVHWCVQDEALIGVAEGHRLVLEGEIAHGWVLELFDAAGLDVHVVLCPAAAELGAGAGEVVDEPLCRDVLRGGARPPEYGRGLACDARPLPVQTSGCRVDEQ